MTRNTGKHLNILAVRNNYNRYNSLLLAFVTMSENFDVEVMYIEMLETFGPERILPIRKDDFYSMEDTKFVTRYRLSKQVVLKVLEEIDDKLEYPTNRNRPVSPLQQLLLTLRFYATGSFQIVSADLSGVSKSTVSRYIRKVSIAISSLASKYIQFPNHDERPQVIQDFYRIAHFPGVIGAIDCTHIPVISPGGHNAEIFRNRKGYFSINVQTICDSNLLIRNIVARWPGSSHDSYIFDNSEIRMKFETGRIRDCHLLGDNGYRLSNYLLTPFLNAENIGEENYNKAHIRTRNTVERQYGVWKRRFPALKLGLRTLTPTSLIIIVSTSVLHNIAIQTKEDEPPEDVPLHQYLQERRQIQAFEEVPLPPIETDFPAPPAAYRQRIVQAHFL